MTEQVKKADSQDVLFQEKANGAKNAKKNSTGENPIAIDEHSLSIEDVCSRYGTVVDLTNVPLSKGVAEERLLKDGPNCLTPAKKVHPFFRYLHFLSGIFNIMLLVAGILSFALNAIPGSEDSMNWILGGILVFVALMNAFIEFIQEYKSSSELESFMNMLPANCLVVRDGKAQEIPAKDLVLGDLVALRNGEKIPADLRLVACSELKVDNSSLTGESEPQERSLVKGNNNPLEANNLAFYGTMIVNGDGYGIVVRTGDRTVLGSIANLTCNETKRESQLANEIEFFVKKMAVIASVFAIAFLAYGLARDKGGNIGGNFSFAVGVLVAFVPQGLPATVTILLTIAAKRLFSLNVLVKDLQGVETLGSITLLASDKTGTLTQNRMTVINTWINTEIHTVQELDHEGAGPGESSAHPNLNLLTKISVLCSKARFDETDKEKPVDQRKIFGDATESGLLRYGALHLEIDKLVADHPKVFEIPFSSATKWHMTFHKMEHENGQITVYLKGAPERIVKMCNKIRINEGIEEWSQKHTDMFNETYERFAGQGQRVLAFAMITLPGDKYPLDYKFVREPANFPLDGFVFIGLFSLMDPPKRGVRKAVASCRTAGIQVVMVTGDHPLTAEAIARKIGLIQGETAAQVSLRLKKPIQMVSEEEYDAIVIHGDRIDAMTGDDWDRVLQKREIVFARTAPHHKLLIVTKCQAKGHIVGVSGDGVNDSPALKKADLGISMNLTGSDVSKEAAAMILIDDNFASIVVGISQGRLIFSNLKKSIRYTLTHILPEAAAFFAYVLAQVPLPLSSILILLIDLGTELLPAISYAWEAPDGDLMLLPPRKVLCTENKNFASFEEEMAGGVSKSAPPKTLGDKIKAVLKKPFQRNETGEILVDNDLLNWSFFQGGLYVTIGCFGAYLTSLALDGVPVSEIVGKGYSFFTTKATSDVTFENGKKLSPSEQLDVVYRAQAAYFMAIVVGQWFTLFLCKKQWDYPVSLIMFKNWRSTVGLVVGLLIVCFLVYVPPVHEIGTRNVHIACWGVAIAAGVGLFLHEIVRKFFRKKGYFGGIPKKNANLLELVRTTSTM